MNSTNQYNQPWPITQPSTTNDIPATSHPLTAQQYGSTTPHQVYQPRSADTMNSTTHRQAHHPLQFTPAALAQPRTSHPHPIGNATSHDHIGGRQASVVSPTAHSGPDHHSPTSDRQPWALTGDDGNGGQFPLLPGQPQSYKTGSSGRRTVDNPPAASAQKCRIPDCTYNAFYNVFEQEQSEYCGQGHELQAVLTGLVASCVMCKARPRRTGERVCGRTCREKERQAPRVQGSYYGVSVVRTEPRP